MPVRSWLVQLLALSLAPAMFAGCFSGSSGAAWIVIDENGVSCASEVKQCPSGAATDAGFIVQDFSTDAPLGTVALLIQRSGTVEIANAAVSAMTIAVSWSSRTACGDCRLILRDVEIVAAVKGVDFDVPGGTLEVRGGSMIIDWNLDPLDSPQGLAGKHGFLVHNAAAVLLEDINVSTTALWGATGLMAWQREGLIVQASNTSFTGFEVGLQGYLLEVGPGPLRIDCDISGLEGTSFSLVGLETLSPSFSAQGLSIRGCRDVALDAGISETLHLRDIQVLDSEVGIETTNAKDMALERFVLRNNSAGALLESGVQETLVVRDGIVESNADVGISSGFSTMQVENVSFIGNGDGLAIDVTAPGAQAEFTVEGSSFETNSGCAMSYPGFSVVKATGNWWGSPAGPTALPPGTGPGDTQAVCGPILTAPHRASP